VVASVDWGAVNLPEPWKARAAADPSLEPTNTYSPLPVSTQPALWATTVAAPTVNTVDAEQNPNSSYDPLRDGTFLDLQPQTPGSDQYCARYAADQGQSAVERPENCALTGPRADN
jgi:hypothetical protein